VAEDGQEAGGVFAQVGTEAVAGLDTVPDGVLVGSGQDGDGLGEVAVRGQGTVFCGVGAQAVGQDFGSGFAVWRPSVVDRFGHVCLGDGVDPPGKVEVR
jgi:hypothetical protein